MDSTQIQDSYKSIAAEARAGRLGRKLALVFDAFYVGNTLFLGKDIFRYTVGRSLTQARGESVVRLEIGLRNIASRIILKYIQVRVFNKEFSFNFKSHFSVPFLSFNNYTTKRSTASSPFDKEAVKKRNRENEQTERGSVANEKIDRHHPQNHYA